MFRILTILIVLGFFLVSCGGGGDDGGSSGGSGEAQPTSESENPQSEDTGEVVNPSTSSSEVWLDAYTFSCTSNWTNREGPLGLEAYSGSGNCVKSFPGTSGTYQLVLKAVTEYDGEPPYRVSLNGTTIQEGTYPLSSDLGCNCPSDSWRTVCPDKTEDIDLGTHTINTGDTIEFYGDDVYPCGGHGAYAKWYGIMAIRQ